MNNKEKLNTNISKLNLAFNSSKKQYHDYLPKYQKPHNDS